MVGWVEDFAYGAEWAFPSHYQVVLQIKAEQVVVMVAVLFVGAVVDELILF